MIPVAALGAAAETAGGAASVASTAANVAGTVSTVVGTASKIANATQSQGSRSGALNGSIGMMSIKKPFVLITRNRAFNPSFNSDSVDGDELIGNPAYTSVKLNKCKGFTVCDSVRLKTNATIEEQREIESLLMGGVII